MNCICCNSNDVTNKNIYSLCLKCGHKYRFIKDNFLFQQKFHIEIKKSNDEVIKNKINWDVFHKNRKEIVDNRFEIVSNLLDKKYNCLDVGAGGGTFANKIKKYVNSVECLEITDYLCDEISSFGFKVYNNDFIKQDFNKKYDILFAWHILEHIDDIHKFINKCKKLSTKLIILEVPTKRNIPEKYDGHIHMFTKESLNIFLSNYFNDFIIQGGVQKPSLLSIINNI